MFETIDGAHVTYWRSRPPGTGSPTVLLLHGLGADHVGLLPLAGGWPGADVIAPDLPGFGHSDPLPGGHSMLAYAHVLDVLCERLGLRDVTVVGHSLGASIALAFTALYPDRVRDSVLISPVTDDSGPSTWLVHAYYHLGSLLPEHAARHWFLSRPAVYLADLASFSASSRTVRREILREDYRTAALASPRAIAEIYRSIRSYPYAEYAAAIRTPALIIGAVRDSLASPRSLVALHRGMRRSRLVIVPGAGHLWPAEHPATAARVIAAAMRAFTRPAAAPSPAHWIAGTPAPT